jgi:hypothetical protein
VVTDSSEAASPETEVPSRWPLLKVFDVVAAVLSGIVVIRAVGGIVSASGVPSVHVNLGAASGLGATIQQSDFGIPTFVRLEYGTGWADLISGLMLLTAVALVALPRMVWDIPADEQGLVAGPKLMMGVFAVTAVAVVASVVNTVNQIWHTDQLSPSTEALTVAEGVAAIALLVLVAVLAWFALPFVRSEPAAEHSSSPSAPSDALS